MTKTALALVSLVAIAIAMVGCASLRERCATTTDRNGVTVCRIHRVPIASIDGYSLQPGIFLELTPEYIEASDGLPNYMIGILVSDENFNVPNTLNFCPACETKFQERLEKLLRQAREKMPNNAIHRTLTRVTPPASSLSLAEQESRHG